ncbi:hypothetical protein GCM10017562_56310 [Streptomyces roseofulvus]
MRGLSDRRRAAGGSADVLDVSTVPLPAALSERPELVTRAPCHEGLEAFVDGLLAQLVGPRPPSGGGCRPAPAGHASSAGPRAPYRPFLWLIDDGGRSCAGGVV